jgi:hypothetical protein
MQSAFTSARRCGIFHGNLPGDPLPNRSFAFMTTVKPFIFAAVLLAFSCAKPTFREMAQPTVDRFCKLYSSSAYDSIITMLRTRNAQTLDAAAQHRLSVMLRMFRQKLGPVKGGSISDVEFIPVSDKDSVIRVEFEGDFEAGPGYIRFDFSPAARGLVLDKFEFSSNLLGPDFMQLYKKELAKPDGPGAAQPAPMGARP